MKQKVLNELKSIMSESPGSIVQSRIDSKRYCVTSKDGWNHYVLEKYQNQEAKDVYVPVTVLSWWMKWK